ncbi:CHASE2 domain-containing protein [Mastigocoleus testarum]|uniref:Adenylate cyclase n=1 Tax=Mastigocoleus testarum BC008 TaxID=371196 RepID=A0A0V7ZPP1_9CYAN|nr:adenylate/guanylate cyclase domain-containing protein [Mastigocoleus testarum]KST66311.1 adenylate cyclase [Mastigocoleus testarum BC008]KST66632.1 adenylate cyclase [Mastigocoleus testarum BC008]
MWVSLKELMWQWRGVLIASPSVALLLIGLRLAGLLQSLELAAWDQFFRLRPSETVDSPITIVEMNESDIRKLGWPLSDAKLARLLSVIKQHKPRVIGLDFYRDLPVEPGFEELEKVFASTPNLFAIHKVIGSTVGFGVNPPTKLRELGQVSASDIVVDQDGRVRRNLLSVENKDGEITLGLGTQLALSYLEAEGISLEIIDEQASKLKLGKGIFIELDENDGGYIRNDIGGYQILANFHNLRAGFPTISMSQVLEGKITAKFIRDRIVLIGPTAESLGDFFYTPYRDRSSGVSIHADIASQIISAAKEGRPQIQVWSDTYEYLWIAIWSLVGATLSWAQRYKKQTRWSHLSSSLIILLLGTCLLGGSYLAFWKAALWIPVVPGFLALFGGATTVTGIVARDSSKMRQTFGRYLTNEVVATLLETSEGLKIGGEKKHVTVLISDLRGFSAMSEQVSPEKVLEIINLYLAEMTDTINHYKGTINDFMGDGIFVMFGAPVSFADNAQRAVSCAISMQLAMDGINQKLLQMQLPPLEMGIGIHSGEVLAGSIGSYQRAKYTVMGSNVNLAARIETYTVGGQILVSQETLDAVGEIMRISGELQVQPKGFTNPITIYEVEGIGGKYNLFLQDKKESLKVLATKILVKYRVTQGKHISDKVLQGWLVKLSLDSADICTGEPLQVLSNLRVQLATDDEKLNHQQIYAKVVKVLDEKQNYFRLRFTALPTDIKVCFQDLCE